MARSLTTVAKRTRCTSERANRSRREVRKWRKRDAGHSSRWAYEGVRLRYDEAIAGVKADTPKDLAGALAAERLLLELSTMRMIALSN